ncbi:hypothetical protein GGF37_000797, partial [Kickxella alabastrina]
TKLANLGLKKSSYDRSIALPKYLRHTVVCGHIELELVQKFLQEYIARSDSITFASTIAILHSDEPSMEMKAMLQESEFVKHVFYVKGHSTDFSALKKVRVDVAKCAYILADKHSPGSGVEEDVGTRMTMMAVSVFGVSSNQAHQTDKRRKNLSPKIKVFAQTLLPGSISHLAYPQTTRVMCVDEMRMGIMAQNCATPGFAALAYMLSTSVSKHADWDLSGALEENIAKSADMNDGDRKALRTKIVPRAMQYTDVDGLTFGANPLSPMPNPSEPLLKRAFLDGSIFVPGMLDTLLCQRRSKLRTVDFLRHLTLSHLTDTSEANSIKAFNPSQLNLLTMPDYYIGQSYSTMVCYMMEYYAVVPLVILRVSPTNGQPFYSVICNLRPFTIMDEADTVYILGPPIPRWN